MTYLGTYQAGGRQPRIRNHRQAGRCTQTWMEQEVRVASVKMVGLHGCRTVILIVNSYRILLDGEVQQVFVTRPSVLGWAVLWMLQIHQQHCHVRH